jgi:hypothetical protein
VKCDSLEGPSEREIADFYNAHREEFLRTETEVKFAYFEGVEERTLTEIAGKLKGGAKERGLASTYPALNFGWERIIDPGSLPPPYNQFMNYKVGQVLGPLPLGDKYYVFKITAVLKPGTLKMLIEVRDLITERIMGDKRFRMREMLLKSLRTKYHPELNVKLLRNSGLVQGVK